MHDVSWLIFRTSLALIVKCILCAINKNSTLQSSATQNVRSVQDSWYLAVTATCLFSLRGMCDNWVMLAYRAPCTSRSCQQLARTWTPPCSGIHVWLDKYNITHTSCRWAFLCPDSPFSFLLSSSFLTANHLCFIYRYSPNIGADTYIAFVHLCCVCWVHFMVMHRLWSFFCLAGSNSVLLHARKPLLCIRHMGVCSWPFASFMVDWRLIIWFTITFMQGRIPWSIYDLHIFQHSFCTFILSTLLEGVACNHRRPPYLTHSFYDSMAPKQREKESSNKQCCRGCYRFRAVIWLVCLSALCSLGSSLSGHIVIVLSHAC